MSTRWWWIRHGPTHADGLVGHLDLPADLSDSLTLTNLDRFLPDNAPVISSDLVRAAATADRICNARQRLPSTAELREMDYGDWDGRSFADITRSDPVLSRQYWEEPGHTAPPNGESWNRFAGRIHAEITRISHEYPNKDLIIVAHFGVILAALQLATSMDARSIFSFKINNLSVSSFTHLPENNAWRVEMVNQSVKF